MKARFDREAQTIAGLDHPHICVLYDLGHQEGSDYLVMEYLQGQTIAIAVLVNLNVYTQTSLDSRIDAVEALESALVN